MISLTVEATHLGELLWNLALFTPKVGVTEGRAALVLQGEPESLHGYACDDFITVHDHVPATLLSTEPATSFFEVEVDVADLKKAESWIRKVTGLVTLEIAPDNQLRFSGEAPEADEQEYVTTFSVLRTDPWSALIGMLSEGDNTEGMDSDRFWTWALNPERLKNLARMKTGGEHPLDFRQASIENFEDVATWQFKLGPRIQGLITPMDRNVLREKGCVLWN